MADIVITAANVAPSTGARQKQAIAGEAITQGQFVYIEAATGHVKKANAVTSAATAAGVGIALTAGSTGQPVLYQTSGDIVIGATLTQGAPYFLSGAANGGICPGTDLTTNWITRMAGIAKSTTVLSLFNVSAGTAHS